MFNYRIVLDSNDDKLRYLYQNTSQRVISYSANSRPNESVC